MTEGVLATLDQKKALTAAAAETAKLSKVSSVFNGTLWY
jgi:hypothetical protein